MPFGSGDREVLGRLTAQLGEISRDLAALRQQAADQQHAIDQARQETTAAIAAGLNDIRATVRDGLDRGTERTSDTLTRIGSDLGVIRDGIHRLGQAAAAPPPAAAQEREPAPEPAPTPVAAVNDQTPDPEPQPEPDEPSDGDATLQAAAGIAHATIEAHRDTWAFLIQTAGREQHFHIPGKVDDSDGFVKVRVSGPSIVAAITSLGHVAATAGDPVTRAIAAHVHQKITGAVKAVIDSPRSGDPGAPVRIVIDDRAATGGNDQPENE